MQNQNFNYGVFESISETSENQLIGGFSASVSLNTTMSFAEDTNNCHGGNCTSGCGTGQNALMCNTVAGCAKN